MHTVSNLSPRSFDKTNEKTLLVLIHFLLCLIDPTFRLKCEGIYPYRQTSEKNEFKLKVQESLTNLIILNILDHSDCRVTILTIAKGYAVWILLWKLTLAALDAYLLSESIPLPPCSSSVLPGQLKALSLVEIEKMNEEIEGTRERIDRKKAFAAEIEQRLKAALQKIDLHSNQLKKLGSSDKGMYLSSAGKLKRSEMVMKIQSIRGLQSIISSLSVESDDSTSKIIEPSKIDAHTFTELLSSSAKHLDSLHIRQPSEYASSGVVDDVEIFSEEQLDSIANECRTAVRSSAILLQKLQDNITRKS